MTPFRTLLLFALLIVLVPVESNAGGALLGNLGWKRVNLQRNDEAETFSVYGATLELGGTNWRLVGQWSRSEYVDDTMLSWFIDTSVFYEYDYTEKAVGLRRFYGDNKYGIYTTLGVNRIHVEILDKTVDPDFFASDDPFGFWADIGWRIDAFQLRFFIEARYAHTSSDYRGKSYNVGGYTYNTGLGFAW